MIDRNQVKRFRFKGSSFPWTSELNNSPACVCVEIRDRKDHLLVAEVYLHEKAMRHNAPLITKAPEVLDYAISMHKLLMARVSEEDKVDIKVLNGFAQLLEEIPV